MALRFLAFFDRLVYSRNATTSAYLGRTARYPLRERLFVRGACTLWVLVPSGLIPPGAVYSRKMHLSLHRLRGWRAVCSLSAGAARCSVPFVDNYGSLVTEGTDAPMVLFVRFRVNASRGRWLDYRRRLQLMASTPLTLIAPLKRCLGSSQFRVAPLSLRQCSGPAGSVFPAAYRAAGFFHLDA